MKKSIITAVVVVSLLFPTIASAAPKSERSGSSVVKQIIVKIRHLIGLDDFEYTPPKP